MTSEMQLTDNTDYISSPAVIVIKAYRMRIESQYLADGRKIFEQFPFNSMDHGLLNPRLEALLDSLFLRI